MIYKQPSIYKSGLSEDDIKNMLGTWTDEKDKFERLSPDPITSITSFHVYYNEALGLVNPVIAIAGNFQRTTAEPLQKIFKLKEEYIGTFNQVDGLYIRQGQSNAEWGATARLEQGYISLLYMYNMTCTYTEISGLSRGYIRSR